MPRKTKIDPPMRRTGSCEVYPHPCLKCGGKISPGDKVMAVDCLPENLCMACWEGTAPYQGVKDRGSFDLYFMGTKSKNRKSPFTRIWYKFVEATVVTLEV